MSSKLKLTLKSIYEKEQFAPGFLGIFLNPFYFARKELWRAMSDFSPELSGRLLDIGCGSMPYKQLFPVNQYIGLEIDSPSARDKGIADFFYDGQKFPFESETFNSVLCNQVLEHVFNPEEFLSEIARILKPGGRLLLTVPFVWDEHEQPFDYARYSSFGIIYLIRNSGLIVIEHQKLGADISTIFQLLNGYIYKEIQNFPRFIRITFSITLMAFFNIIGIILKFLLPKNLDLYLDNVIVAKKM